jgi:hypothetical protein
MPDTDPAQWLIDLFEYEYCAECGGDAQHHTVVSVLDNPFARCDYPTDADGRQNIIVAAYRDGVAVGRDRLIEAMHDPSLHE